MDGLTHPGGVEVLKHGRRSGRDAVLVRCDHCGNTHWIKAETLRHRIANHTQHCGRCSRRQPKRVHAGSGGVTVLAKGTRDGKPGVRVRYSCCGREGWLSWHQYLFRVRQQKRQCFTCFNASRKPTKAERAAAKERRRAKPDYFLLAARVILAAGGGRPL